MSALTMLVPWWGRLLIVGILVAACVAFGAVRGANHVQDKWDLEKAAQTVAVAKQTAKVEIVKNQQEKTNQGVKDETDKRIDGVHTYYGGLRLSVRGGSTMRSISGSTEQPETKDPNAGSVASIRQESYLDLAERCGVTTAIALGWQEWYEKQKANFDLLKD